MISSRFNPITRRKKHKMILTNCAACAAPLAHNAPRCVRCWTRYGPNRPVERDDAHERPRRRRAVAHEVLERRPAEGVEDLQAALALFHGAAVAFERPASTRPSRIYKTLASLVLSLHMRGQRSRVMKRHDDYPRTHVRLPETRARGSRGCYLAQAELKKKKKAPPHRYLAVR